MGKTTFRVDRMRWYTNDGCVLVRLETEASGSSSLETLPAL